MVAYSPHAKRVGKKLKEIRECVGLTQKEAARHLGVEEKTLSKYETGILVPGREMQRRFLLYYFGKWSWQTAPSAPAVMGSSRKSLLRTKISISQASAKKLDELCKRFGASAGAIVELALEQLHDNVPVLTTLKEAARKYEDLRWKSILETNQDLSTILESDPIMARIAHEGLKYVYAKDKLLDPKFLTEWLSKQDGAYMEAARIRWRAKEEVV